MMNRTQFLGISATVLAVACLVPAPATAQGTTPMPLAKAVVSNEVASRTLFKYQINANVARQIVDACVEFANKQQGGPGNYAIFIVAPNGDIVDAHVMDGVVPIGVETGLMKAKTALYARSPSRAVAERFPNVEGRLIRTDLGREGGLSVLLRPRRRADRARESAHWRHWNRRREHGRAVRVLRAWQGARHSASSTTAGR